MLQLSFRNATVWRHPSVWLLCGFYAASSWKRTGIGPHVFIVTSHFAPGTFAPPAICLKAVLQAALLFELGSDVSLCDQHRRSQRRCYT